MSDRVIGALDLRLAIYDAVSLKDKRSVIKSLKERLGNRFNVSVAEIGLLDQRRQAELAVVIVGNDGRFIQSCLDKVVDYVRSDPGASLVDYEIELF